jgi:hypothetical protein
MPTSNPLLSATLNAPHDTHPTMHFNRFVNKLFNMYVRDKRSPVPKSETVSRVMSANRAKNSKPELLLRKPSGPQSLLASRSKSWYGHRIMKRKMMKLLDTDGIIWRALEHSIRYRVHGPTKYASKKSCKGIIAGESVTFFQGEPRQTTVKGASRGGTRVSFSFNASWWHVTATDQSRRNNLYQTVGDCKKSLRFTITT